MMVLLGQLDWKFKYNKKWCKQERVVHKQSVVAFGGSVPPVTGATEEYDGTTWTTSPTSLNTARQQLSRSRNTSICISFWRLYYS
jgi:hypothetical protein